MSKQLECEGCVVKMPVHCFLWARYEQKHLEEDLEELRECPCIECIVKMMCVEWCETRMQFLRQVTGVNGAFTSY